MEENLSEIAVKIVRGCCEDCQRLPLKIVRGCCEDIIAYFMNAVGCIGRRSGTEEKDFGG